ncbi:MAG: formyltransferase family protein [Candidatus Woesearchaeota archaeon]|nr:formyltransferase family protein [Candidatus Woesearchaeota archaeon]
MESLYSPKDTPMRVAIFMSGSGTNAKKIIEAYIANRDAGRVFFEPVLVFTDNPASNAVKIAKEDYREHGVTLPVVFKSYKEFMKCPGATRGKYDMEQCKMLDNKNVDCVALAGYDWIVTPIICENFLTVNVHPGDLRVKKPNGKPAYAGLAWVPSAKAVLAGENNVYTSVHKVTEVLDGGSVLAVSDAVPVPDNVKSLEDRAVLLGEAKSVSEIEHFIRDNPSVEGPELRRKFPVYGVGKDLQNILKEFGDWVVFPRVLRDIARGLYSLDGDKAYLDGTLVLEVSK